MVHIGRATGLFSMPTSIPGIRLVAGLLCLLPPLATATDTLYVNARIYTVDATDSSVEAMAVTDGRITATGSRQAIQARYGASAQVVDLGGRFVMPGIQDMHVHPTDGGIKGRFECTFPDTASAAEAASAVAACAAKAKPGEWIQGGQWGPGLLEANKPADLLRTLDAASPENPVFLMDWALHNAWVNSAALRLLGIGPETPDVTGGVIVRDAVTGKPTGILLDNAAYIARGKLPAYTPEQITQALEYSIDHMAANGITSFRDALTTERNLAGYQTLAQSNRLKLFVGASLAWKSAWSSSHERETAIIEVHSEEARPRLDTRFAKIMLDGIPPTYTAAVLEPYNATAEFGTQHVGELMIEPDVLAADVTRLDALGLTVKMHATGDRSLRTGLDAIEAARRTNGPNGPRHEISHAEMIHPDDLPRFASLNAAAEMCPILWYPSAAVDAMRLALGPRADRFWPVRSLVESGALVFYGSDWPSVVPDTNPWPGIEAMVTRADPYGKHPGVLWPEQAVNLATALRIFTLNGAIAGRQDNNTGSLEAGKRADFIVLDRDPFDIPPEQLGDVRVLATYVEGVKVYELPRPVSGTP